MQSDEREGGRATANAVNNLREQSLDIERKLDRLVDVYIAQDIERDAYLSKRRALMSDKRTIEEQIARLERDGNTWLEPMREWINHSEMLEEIQKTPLSPPKNPPFKNLRLEPETPKSKVSGWRIHYTRR